MGGGRERRMLMRSEAMRFALANEILKTTAAIAEPTKQSTNLLTSRLFLKWQGLWKGQMIAASSYTHRAQQKDWFLHTIPLSQKLTSLILQKLACQPC